MAIKEALLKFLGTQREGLQAWQIGFHRHDRGARGDVLPAMVCPSFTTVYNMYNCDTY